MNVYPFFSQVSDVYLRSMLTNTKFKGGGKRGHIVAHDVSWVGKRAGHKTFVLCPCRANGETFVADTKCF